MKQRKRGASARRLAPEAAAARSGRLTPEAAAARSAYATGVDAMLAGNRAMAAALYRRCIDLDATHGEAHHGLATIAALEGRLPEAVSFFEKTIALLPDHAEAYANLCMLLTRTGRLAEAVASGRKAIAIRPSYVNGHTKLAAALVACGRPDEAIEVYRTALRIEPASDLIHFWLADLLTRLERNEEALAVCRAGLAIDPKRADAHNLLGVIYKQLGQTQQSFEALYQAVTLKPDFAQAHINLSSVLCQIAQFDAAVASGSIAVRLAPNDPAAFFNYAVALRYTGDLAKSVEMRRRALLLAPEATEWLVDITTTRRFMCDWDGLAEEQVLAAELSYKRGKRASPFSILTSLQSPADHLLSARVWAAGLKAEPLDPAPAACPAPAGRRLRIGYVSGDFYIHATALLLAGMLEHHDRTRFELFGYSIGHNDGSALRDRLVRSFDRFVDLRSVSNGEAARLIRADGIDILIDLKGYTDGARTEIFAARPAAIQVNYLGYPGSMGAAFMDYIVVDAFVAPLAQAHHFDERIVHLPNCYQPNDRQRDVASRALSRSGLGLPEQGFVFCCFNNTYKITAELFTLWMRLLAATPGSVLWLFGSNEVAVHNLRREAASRGVAPERLVFAPRVSTAEHIARMSLGDLFLDTFPVNAHTTASEALWAGLPVVTYAGEAFVSRVAGSLLHAIGLPDLVTGSLADYEALALALARDEARLAAVKARLLANRESSSLFDTRRYTRNFEAALVRMAEIRAQGGAPAAFAVTEP